MGLKVTMRPALMAASLSSSVLRMVAVISGKYNKFTFHPSFLFFLARKRWLKSKLNREFSV